MADKVQKECASGHRRLLIDGFPRNVEKAELFEAQVAIPSAVFLFDCAEDVAKARFIGRKRGDDGAQHFDKRCAEFKQLNGAIVRRYAAILTTVS